MSLVIIPAKFHPSAFARFAKLAAPYKPCSSATIATKIKVQLNLVLLITLANSMAAAVPEASSLAPGAKILASFTSEALES